MACHCVRNDSERSALTALLSSSLLRGVLGMKHLMYEAAPAHQPETLAMRQADRLLSTLPNSTSSHHYSQVCVDEGLWRRRRREAASKGSSVLISYDDMPLPSCCFNQILSALASSGVCNTLLDMGPDPSIAEAAIASIPQGIRVLLFYTSPDR